jgi:hypothetical protein
LPHPQAIFEIGFFKENPTPFFTLAKELYPGSFKPTPCHYFIKLLEEKGLLLRHYTQNIDTLERVAGIEGDKLVEAHGTFHAAHCIGCRKEYTQEWIKGALNLQKMLPIFIDMFVPLQNAYLTTSSPRVPSATLWSSPTLSSSGSNFPTAFPTASQPTSSAATSS